MPGFQCQLMFGDEGDYLLHFREQLSVLGHRNERAVLFREAHLVLGIEGRHPDYASPAALHQHHALDCRGIDAAHRAIEVDSAEDLDAWHFFAYDVSKRRSGFVVVLQYQPTHAATLGEPREIDRIDRPRGTIRIAVYMDIDHLIQLLSICGRGKDDGSEARG